MAEKSFSVLNGPPANSLKLWENIYIFLCTFKINVFSKFSGLKKKKNYVSLVKKCDFFTVRH